MRDILFQLILATLLAVPTLGQQATFSASANAKKVPEQGYFDVTFTLNNAEGSQFVPPNFQHFKVVGGPNQSTQMSIVNGRMTRKMSFTYSILAPKIGTFTIASASIVANGKTLKSNPIKIEVIKGKKAVAGKIDSDSPDIFVQLELSDSTVYIGQQITAKYVLYTTKDVSSVDFMTEPSYEGFFSKRVRNLGNKAERVIVDGVQYTKKSLRTMAIFPQQTGKFTIDEVFLNLGLPVEDGRRNSFFFKRTTPFRTNTQAVDIEVLSTPSNAPVSFSGAIGKYTMAASVDKTSITTDDALTMTMQVRGIGDGKFLQAPQQVNDAFDIYDPNVLKDESLERGDVIRVEKVFEYLMVPKEKGAVLVKPEFTYYDVDSNAYVTLYANTFRVNVLQGTGSQKARVIDKDNLGELSEYAFADTTLSKEKSFFFGSPLHLSLISLPFLSMLGLVFYKRKELAEAAIDPTLKRQSAAQKIAIARLEAAKTEKDKGKHKEFFAEINNSIYGYIRDKYVIPNANLNKAYISNLLVTKANKEDQVPVFEEIIDACQMAMYAGASIEKVDSIYLKSIDLITTLEEA
jgi:hypothetical protein